MAGDLKERPKNLNPGENDYNRHFNDMRSVADTEAGGTFNDSSADNADQPDNTATDVDELRDQEDNPGGTRPGWQNNVTGESNAPQPISNLRGLGKYLLKGRAGVLTGGIVIVVIGIIVLVGLFGPAALLPALASNLAVRNDTGAKLLQKRVVSTFRGMVEMDDIKCPNTSKKLSCMSSRVSYKFLANLEERGVKAYGNGLPDDLRSQKGYPAKRPAGYTVKMPDGTLRNIKAAELAGFLEQPENRSIAAKLYGSKGLLSTRKAWSGKHMAKKFYKPFGIDRGSRFSKLATELKRKVTLADAREQLKNHIKKLPGITSAPPMEERFQQKLNKNLGRAGKAGPVYLAAAAGCMATKIPSFVGAAVTGVQLLQIMPLIQDIVLAPEGKLRAGDMKPEEMDMIATLLTEKTPRPSDGKMTAAVDSIYLQQAIGVNSNRVPVSDYAPGYLAMKNPALLVGTGIGEAAEPLCDGILSEGAMYTALAVDTAVTVGLGFMSGGALGAIKAVGNVAVSAVVGIVATHLIGAGAALVATDLVAQLAGTLPAARGEHLGDILGVSALTFFGAGSLANMATVLRESDVASANQQILGLEEREREMDIASLSPFDISSRHTFAGSLLNSLQTTATMNGASSNLLLTTLGSIFRAPSRILSGDIAKANSPTIQCYGKEFGYTMENPVCVNSAGVPVSFQTSVQAGMSTTRAQEIIEQQSGWIDESKAPADSASLSDLVESGYIKPDTLLSSWIETCGQDLMLSGDYIMSADGCTATPANTPVPPSNQSLTYTNEDGETVDLTGVGVVDSEESGQPVGSNTLTSDEMAIQAITPALTGFIIAQTLNGENEEDFSGNSDNNSASTGDFHRPLPESITADATTYPVVGRAYGHGAVDIAAESGTEIYAVSDGTVTSSGYNGSWGNYVRIEHANGMQTGYAHMVERPPVNVGDTVKVGQVIGHVGSTGGSTGAHLHFEIYYNGERQTGEVVFAWLKERGFLPNKRQESIVYDP